MQNREETVHVVLNDNMRLPVERALQSLCTGGVRIVVNTQLQDVWQNARNAPLTSQVSESVNDR
jgi:hypothetical protein